MAEYVSNRSFDDAYFKDLIINFIKKGGKVKRKDIDNLIIPKLSNILSDAQKKNKVTNFLSSLRIAGIIESTEYSTWTLRN